MTRTRAKSADALALLKEDHHRLEDAFRQFEKLDRHDIEACRSLALRVCEALKVHTAIEEDLFYPALREVVDDEEILNEAAVEHETASMLIEQLENMDADDPNYHATFTVLGEYVGHHIREEESDMFPQAKKNIDLDALGARMHARRQELLGEGTRPDLARDPLAGPSPLPGRPRSVSARR
jgi:hemerythrin-like domain-containing protein